MNLNENNLAIPSWLQEMADHAKFSVTLKDRTHRFILVNSVFFDHVSMQVKDVIGKIDCKERIFASATTNDVSCDSVRWRRDDEAITSRLPSFHLKPYTDQFEHDTAHAYTSRFPLLDDNGNTSHLLTLSTADEHEIDVAQQQLAHENLLHVILELNPELSVARHTSERHKNQSVAFKSTHEYVVNGYFQLPYSYFQTALKTNYSCFSTNDTCATDSSTTTISNFRVSFENEQDRIYQPNDFSTAYTHDPCSTIGEYTDVTEMKNTLHLLERERKQIARRLEIQSSLGTLLKKMEEVGEYVPLLQRIAEVVIELLGADTTYLTIVDESNEFMEVVAVAGSNLSQIGFKLKYGEGIGGAAWSTGEIQTISDYPKYANKISGFDDFKQVCVIPLKVHGNVVGVIGVVYESYSDMFLERVIEFEEFAQQITIIVENAKLIESVRVELSRNQVLYKLSNAVFVSKQIKTVLDYACDIVIDHCDTKFTQIFQTDSSGTVHLSAMGNAFKTHNSDDILRDSQVSSVDKPIGDLIDPTLIQKCLETQKPLMISRLDAKNDSLSAVYLARQQHEIGSSVCIPLVHDDVVWGAFVAHRDKSRSDFSDADINLFGAIANQASVALNRHKLLSEVEFQAYHDTLTGLSNRLQFEERLNLAIEAGKREYFRVAVLFIDLDGFKHVNDNYGHSTGDALLKELSKRLLEVFHSGYVVARMGGDEFAVVLTHVETLEEVITISENTIKVLSEEYSVEGVTVKIGASIGVSIFPDDSDSAGCLLKNADFAMYQSKSLGKGCAQYYDDAMASRFQRRVDNENDLAKAIDNNELRLVFQPKVNVSSQRVSGVEALLRWESQSRGNIPPDEFIPIAEESGLIIPIGNWVLMDACRQLAEWHRMGFDDLTISVNVSAPQFSTGNYVNTVENVLKSATLDARYLDLEVTESVMMVDVESSVKKLLELKALGISVSIDDFGTGFSSLRYLEDLPLDNLKIDKSFIERLDDSNPQLSLTNTIIGIADAFSLGTVAEGVETEEQLEKVLALGCDCIQGYYFSKPVEAIDLPDTILRIEQELSRSKAAA